MDTKAASPDFLSDSVSAFVKTEITPRYLLNNSRDDTVHLDTGFPFYYYLWYAVCVPERERGGKKWDRIAINGVERCYHVFPFSGLIVKDVL